MIVMRSKRPIRCSVLPRNCLIGLAVSGVIIGGLALATAAPSSGKEIVFDETVIEGKVKRPQVVLIAADQRPVFQPMAINNFRDTLSTWADRVDPDIFEQNRFERALPLELERK